MTYEEAKEAARAMKDRELVTRHTYICNQRVPLKIEGVHVNDWIIILRQEMLWRGMTF